MCRGLSLVVLLKTYPRLPTDMNILPTITHKQVLYIKPTPEKSDLSTDIGSFTQATQHVVDNSAP